MTIQQYSAQSHGATEKASVALWLWVNAFSPAAGKTA